MSDVREDLLSVMNGGGDGGGEAAAVEPSAVVAEPGAAEGGASTGTGAGDGAPGSGEQKTGEGGGNAAAQRARDAAGKFTKAEAAAKAKSAAVVVPTATATLDPAKAGTVPEPAAPVVPAPEAIKAPQSWKPAAREKWASLAPEAQQEIARRERETATALQESAEARRVHQQFREVVAPYEGMMRAAGSEPLQTIAQLLQTGAGLRQGTPQRKADLVADIVKQYDVPIEMLAAALDRGQPGQGTPQGQQQGGDMGLRQEVAELKASIQNAWNQRNQVQTQKMQADITAFAAGHEFFEDVRHDVADLMDSRAKRGVAITLEDAYNLACKMHPEITGVFEQRKAAEAAKAAQASTQRAQAASSSVRSQPAGSAPRPQSGSVRDDLAAAIEAANGR